VLETPHQRNDPPQVVAVGGLDSTGGAGLVRDFLTGRALGAQMVLVGTAWTLQSPADVAAIDPRAPDRLQQDVAAALATTAGRAVAVKIGMLAGPAQVAALISALERFDGPVVLDPVLTASSGTALFIGDPAQLLPLVRRADLVTPNLAEAAALTGRPVGDAEQARSAADELIGLGAKAVLVKGGHLFGAARDLLVWAGGRGAGGQRELTAPRIPGASPRGTGCALATAIAVHLAAGRPLSDAVATAKTWLHQQIAAARPIGPEHHL
jgi:hydroxymethylpyrimidine/phosphomethylpyrimidine kinase